MSRAASLLPFSTAFLSHAFLILHPLAYAFRLCVQNPVSAKAKFSQPNTAAIYLGDADLFLDIRYCKGICPISANKSTHRTLDITCKWHRHQHPKI